MRNYTKLFAIFSLLALVATSCSDDAEDLKPAGGDEAVVVIKPKIDIEILSRAMSDGSNVDKLVVATFKGDESTPTVRKVLDLTDAVANGVELRLVSGLSYKVLFWAYDADNTAYTVGADGIITANYASYLTGGFAKMEQLDAFYVVDAFTVTGSFNRNVTLTRPFAQMSFADKATRPTSGTHSCKVSYTAVSTSFNPFTGQTSGSADLTFTYTDFPEETITQDANTYYYVATTYLFPTPSAKIDATCVLYSGATELTRHQLSNLPMAANYRTNILGTMVQVVP